jgi:hypothetical protein
MRVCKPNDAESMARFRRALQSLSTEPVEAYDVDDIRLCLCRIGDEVLSILCDQTAVEIDGSPAVVRQVFAAMDAAGT